MNWNIIINHQDLISMMIFNGLPPGKGGRQVGYWKHSSVIWERNQKQPSALVFYWLSSAAWKTSGFTDIWIWLAKATWAPSAVWWLWAFVRQRFYWKGEDWFQFQSKIFGARPLSLLSEIHAKNPSTVFLSNKNSRGTNVPFRVILFTIFYLRKKKKKIMPYKMEVASQHWTDWTD